MSPRTGRPPTDGKRKEERITFRANELDLQRINYCMEKTGQSKSGVIRKGIEGIYLTLKGNHEKK